MTKGTGKTMRNGLVAGVLAVSLAGVEADEWWQWRGPFGQGVAGAERAPRSLSPEKNAAWKVELPGRGCSTPVVVKGTIMLTLAIDGEDGVLALDGEGKELWRRKLGTGAQVRHANAGSACNPSPVTDGDSLFVYFKSGTLAGLGMDGSVKWKKNLQSAYAKDGLKWDLGTSPILAGGHVVVAMLHNNSPSFLLAFDKATGKELWKTPRDFNAPAEANDSYGTPFVAEVDGVETIVTWAGDHLTGHDAQSGKELWRHGDFNPQQAENWRTIASAAETEGVALVPFGRGGFVAGVKMGGNGDTTKTHRLWTLNDRGSDSATPAAAGGKFYLLNDSGKNRGIVSCLEARTGKVEWETTLPKSAAIYYASPLLVGNSLYLCRSDGTVFCGTITPKGLTDVEESELGETLVATPVAVDGKLLVRTHEHMWCFE